MIIIEWWNEDVKMKASILLEKFFTEDKEFPLSEETDKLFWPTDGYLIEIDDGRHGKFVVDNASQLEESPDFIHFDFEGGNYIKVNMNNNVDVFIYQRITVEEETQPTQSDINTNDHLYNVLKTFKQ